MEATTNRLDRVLISPDFVDTQRKEVEAINSTTHGETSTPRSTNGLVIERIRRKLQISEWNVHMANVLPNCLTSSEVKVKMDVLRSETNRIKLREQMSCLEGEDEFEIAQQIFQAIEEGKLEVFKKLMDGKVADWNFQLEEYGNMTPLLWAILHGQRTIVGAIREHALAKGSSRSMFVACDKFGFRTLNVAVLAYLIVPNTESSHGNVQEMITDLYDWGPESGGFVYSMAFQEGLTHCKIYYGNEDTPTCYYVDHLGHFGSYFDNFHLIVWFAPREAVHHLLLQALKHLDSQTSNGHTVFHLCAWKGRHDILKWLIREIKYLKVNIPGEIINFRDNDRQSPLHLAVLSQDKNSVEILLRTEAINVSVRNWKGYTPMEIASILQTSSSTTISAEDLKRFGVTSFNIESLGLTSDVPNVNVPNSKTHGIHSIECKKDMKALNEIISLFDGLDPEALQRDRQVYVDAANAILVGAALIASASFGAWLQPPLGYMEYYSNEFLVTQPAAPPQTYESFVAIKQHWIIQLFWIFNSLSFFFSIATVVAGANAAFPKKGLILKEAVTSVRHGVIWASYLLFLSVLCVIGTFSTIGFAILPPTQKYRMNMYCTMAIGLATCGVVLIIFLQKLGRPSLLRSWCSKKYNP